MGTKSLRYFRYMLKHKPGKLLAGFTVAAIILKTTAIHPFLNQFARAKYKRIYFAVPFDFLGVLAVVAKNLIIIFKAVRTNSLVQAILRIYVNWRSYPGPMVMGTWYVRCPGARFSGQYIDYCYSIYSNVWYFCPESFFNIALEYQYIRALIE